MLRIEEPIIINIMTCTYWNIKSRLSLIVRVNVVLNRTVLVNSDWCFDNLCGSHLQSQSELYQVSWWYYTLVIDLIGQLRRDVIGRLSVKPWCYWLWRLVISNWRDTTHFDSEDDTAQVVEASVTVNNNSPIQDCVHPDDQTQPTFEITPGFKPFTHWNILQIHSCMGLHTFLMHVQE